MRERYLSMEMPDCVAKVDFLGNHGATVKLELSDGILEVTVTGANYDAPILLCESIEIPETEEE